jgi:hypothetical protein
MDAITVTLDILCFSLSSWGLYYAFRLFLMTRIPETFWFIACLSVAVSMRSYIIAYDLWHLWDTSNSLIRAVGGMGIYVFLTLGIMSIFFAFRRLKITNGKH